MDYAVVALPAAPLRRKPNHRSEMVSQLLFGETVIVLKEKGDLWVKVRGLHDGYEGWTTNTLIQEVDEAFEILVGELIVARAITGWIVVAHLVAEAGGELVRDFDKAFL